MQLNYHVRLPLCQAEDIYILAKSGLIPELQKIYWNKRQGVYAGDDGKEALAQCQEWKKSIIEGMDAFAEEITRVGANVYDEPQPAHPPINEDPHLRELLLDE